MKKKMTFKSVFFISILSVLFILNSGCKKNDVIEAEKEGVGKENELLETDSEGTDMSMLKTILHPYNYGFDRGWSNGFPLNWWILHWDNSIYESIRHYTGPYHAYALKISFTGSQPRSTFCSNSNPGFKVKKQVCKVIYQAKKTKSNSKVRVRIALECSKGNTNYMGWGFSHNELDTSWRTYEEILNIPIHDDSCDFYRIWVDTIVDETDQQVYLYSFRLVLDE